MADRLMYDPFPRKPPAEILRGLREVDRNAELLNVYPGVWVLGVVRPSRIRREKAAATLAELDRKAAEAGDMSPIKVALHMARLAMTGRRARLAYAGFSTIAQYQMNDPTNEIVADFRERDWKYRKNRDAEFEQRLDVAEGLPENKARKDLMRDLAISEGSSAFDFATKHPVSINVKKEVSNV